MTGAVVLGCALVVAAAIGLWRSVSRGRFTGPRARIRRGSERPESSQALLDVPTWRALGAEPGERATLLQFSSAFCAPCRATRVTLADVAGLVPGVAHVEVDAEQHLDLVRRLDVRSTPTTVVLDPGGAEATRATGAPSRDQVLAALSRMSDDVST